MTRSDCMTTVVRTVSSERERSRGASSTPPPCGSRSTSLFVEPKASCGVLQVTALETRVLQLQADEEVASVMAGPEAQAAAEAKLRQAQEALLAVEQV